MRECSLSYRALDGWLWQVDAATVEPGYVLVTGSYPGGDGHPPEVVTVELPEAVLRLALALSQEAAGC